MTSDEILTGLLFPVVTAVVGAVAGYYIPNALSGWKNRQKDQQADQLYKLLYIKANHLTDLAAGKPVYKARIQRLGQDVEVYDEFESFEINVFRNEQSDFQWYTRTSGVVDYRMLYPWDGLRNNDVEGQRVLDFVSGTVAEASSTFSANAICYNGFQEGHTNQEMIIEKSTKDARLVVDFSSIPGFDSRVFFTKPPQAIQIYGNGQGTEQVDAEEKPPGVFIAYCNNVEKGRGMKMNFFLNWAAISKAQSALDGH